MTCTGSEHRWVWLLAAGTLIGCPSPPSEGLSDASLPPLPNIEAHVDVPDAGPAAAQRQVLPAFVLSFGGNAEIKRAGTEEWVTLKIGDPISQGDQVRTSKDGNVELHFDVGNMVIKEGSYVTLRFLDPKSVGAEVSGGVEATTDGGSFVLQGVGSALPVTTDGGRVSLVADGRGGEQVLTQDGRATIGGQTLGADEVATAQGQKIRKQKVPKKVVLRVTWPEDAAPNTETNKRSITLHGVVSAMATLKIQGETVYPNGDGSFKQDVALHRGPQVITVVAEDPAHRKKVDRRRVVMDPDAPNINAKIRY